MSETKDRVHEICKILDQNKIEDIIYIDMKQIYQYDSFFIVGTAFSDSHLKKVASDIIKTMRDENTPYMKKPSERDVESGWIIVDGTDIVIHLFTREVREKYNIEGLWGKYPQTNWDSSETT